MTASMYPDVIFAPAERESGNYSGIAASGAGSVAIYAKKVPEDITIPVIVVWP